MSDDISAYKCMFDGSKCIEEALVKCLNFSVPSGDALVEAWRPAPLALAPGPSMLCKMMYRRCPEVSFWIMDSRLGARMLL